MNSMIRIGKKVLQALAFANAGNLNDFKALLATIEPKTGAKPAELRLVYARSHRSAMTPPIGHARQAL